MRLRRPESGLSIIEGLIVTALAAILIFSAMKLIKLYGDSVVDERRRGEIADLREYVRGSISCTKTLAQPGFLPKCTAGGGPWISILDAQDRSLTREGNSPTTHFDHQLRAKCMDLDGFYGFAVEHQPMSSKGTRVRNAMTGETIGWTDLFQGIPHACKPGCETTVDFASGADPRLTEMIWGSPPYTCPAFSYVGGVARVICSDNRGRVLRVNDCVAHRPDASIHIEADIRTAAWADGYPAVGLRVGDNLSAIWFSLLSDTVAIIEQAPITLRPTTVRGWGTAAVSRGVTPVLPLVNYRLVVDLSPSNQRFVVRNGATTVADLTTTLPFDPTGQFVNFHCAEATCAFDNIIVRID